MERSRQVDFFLVFHLDTEIKAGLSLSRNRSKNTLLGPQQSRHLKLCAKKKLACCLINAINYLSVHHSGSLELAILQVNAKQQD